MTETILLIVFLSILFVALAMCVVMSQKNDVTLRHRLIIIEAIHDYGVDMIYQGQTPQVSYDDMEDYDKTYYRLWDWSYKRIVPPKEFELIKPYIKKEKKDV
jgi:hypothetical protein